MPKIGNGNANDGSIVTPMATAFAFVVGRSLTIRVSPDFTKYRRPLSVSRYMMLSPFRAVARASAKSAPFTVKSRKTTLRSTSRLRPAIITICLADSVDNRNTGRPSIDVAEV